MSEVWERHRVPLSTYRVQLTAEFNFAHLSALTGYLAGLGITHAYVSPILQAVPGSQHGYDVVDHAYVGTELGGEADLIAAVDALHKAGLQLIVDIVPNHVALPVPQRANPALWALLRDGAKSQYAKWFDLDVTAGNAILMPILGARIDEVLDAGQITIDRAGGPGGEPILRYYDHEFPIRKGTEQLPIEQLLAAQHYRLAHWQMAGEELNYRRFFDVDTLVGIRVEDPDVFEGSHHTLLRLAASGVINGFRVDHPDGLADPAGYLAKLRHESDEPWIVVEKILAENEDLLRDFQCDGTTGYDALAQITGLFVEPTGGPQLTAAFAENTGIDASWAEVVHESKHVVLNTILVAELDRLAALAKEATTIGVRHLDHSLRGITDALAEILVSQEVYRAYIQPGQPAPAVSKHQIEHAVGVALERLPGRAAEIVLLRAMALGELGSSDLLDEFMVRFQQTSGPVMAKGVEDTAGYRWFPLASLCEVGVEPNVFGLSVRAFHEWCEKRQERWPNTMNALSTHDTKRSEDVRARLNVISEVPELWIDWVRTWQYVSEPLLLADGARDLRTEWLLFQTMLGAWPLDPVRLRDYMIKAVREAKVHTSWIVNNAEYESALGRYIDSIYANHDLLAMVRRAVDSLNPGFVTNCLGQRAVQLLMPGLPDIYRGCETVNLRLVDPDNRVAVDQYTLNELLTRATVVPDPWFDLEAAKFRVTVQGLRLRRQYPAAVGRHGEYREVVARGELADHFVAFTRGEQIACVATRFGMKMDRTELGATSLLLPAGRWRNWITDSVVVSDGEPVNAGLLLGGWPVALLGKMSESSWE